MPNWSQSHFLQSLGWATLNSFWQMALFWCIYLLANNFLNISSHKKYMLSIGAIVIGFCWFAFTFFYYLQSSSASTIGIFTKPVLETNSLLNIFLLSASITYLSLLLFPSYKLFRNWKFVQTIKKHGLQKADLTYRLFVQKIGAQLGISKKVFVYLSELVKSPVTVGYLKPIILLPIASLNNLSVQQVEAILLHELSHIKRYDYLVNLMISIISTILYFNPFVKEFMKIIEEEREVCCDQLVLQYGYDKVGYASALLSLEKAAMQPDLVMGVSGKKYLLNRIEKIIGMEKKKRFKMNQFAGILAALFCIVVFNSIIIIKEKKKTGNPIAYTDSTNTFPLFENDLFSPSYTTGSLYPKQNIRKVSKQQKTNNSYSVYSATVPQNTAVDKPAIVETTNGIVNVVLDEVDVSLSKEQKDDVKSTVDATKKVLSSLQWKEIENNIADAMTSREKTKAKEEYLKELDNTVNWKNLEQNLKVQYENIDLEKINTNLNNALNIILLDSLQKNYTAILTQLDKAKACVKAKIAATPMPDQSIEEIRRSTEELRKKVNSIKAIRSLKKIVRL